MRTPENYALFRKTGPGIQALERTTLQGLCHRLELPSTAALRIAVGPSPVSVAQDMVLITQLCAMNGINIKLVNFLQDLL
jgi:hypothetical protein